MAGSTRKHKSKSTASSTRHKSRSGDASSGRKVGMESSDTKVSLIDDIERLLRTNDAASKDVTSQIKVMIDENKSALEQYETEIQETQARLDELRIRYSSLREKTRDYKRAISPVRQLPPEILLEVFRYFRDDPIPISHVCSLWRRTVLSASTLWSRFRMHIRQGQTIQNKLFAKMWLSRARSQPLSILLSHEPSGAVELEAIRSILKPHLATIKKLQLRAPDTAVRALFDDVSCTMPLLEVLDLDITHESLASESLGFLNAPLLHTASVRGPESIFLRPHPLHLKALKLIPHHDRMRSLRLKEISLSSGLLDKIKEYRDLEECDLSFSHGSGNISSLHHIVIPKLRTLRLESIRETKPRSVPKLLAQITVPALTRLDITHEFCSFWALSDEPAAWLRRELVQFLERSRSNLETLTLDLSEYELSDPVELIVLFRAVPSLVRLDIEVHDSTNLSPIFHSMTASTDNSEPLLPSLKQFRVGRLSAEDTKSMVRMVRSRWWSDSNVASRNGVLRLGLVTLLDGPNQSESSLQVIRMLENRAARYEDIDFFKYRWADKICT